MLLLVDWLNTLLFKLSALLWRLGGGTRIVVETFLIQPNYHRAIKTDPFPIAMQ